MTDFPKFFVVLLLLFNTILADEDDKDDNTPSASEIAGTVLKSNDDIQVPSGRSFVGYPSLGGGAYIPPPGQFYPVSPGFQHYPSGVGGAYPHTPYHYQPPYYYHHQPNYLQPNIYARNN